MQTFSASHSVNRWTRRYLEIREYTHVQIVKPKQNPQPETQDMVQKIIPPFLNLLTIKFEYILKFRVVEDP